MRSLTLAAGLSTLAMSGAFAGGYSAPVVDVAPLPVEAPKASPAWQGAYVGAALGYAFNGDDEIGRNVLGVETDIGKAELSGANLSLRAGYRWQRDQWVFGPEVSYTGGNIKDDFDYGLDSNFESKVNHTIAVKVKTGYLVRPDTMVFGLAGWQKGDFTYDNNGSEVDYDADGYVVGLGAEKMLTERMSITGEYEYSNFGKTKVELDQGVTTKATPEFSNVKVGLNFKF